MPRTLTEDGLRAIYKEKTDKVFIELVTITHEDLTPPLRACGNFEPVKQFEGTENEVEFLPYAFRITWPEDHVSRPPQMRIEIDNVDRVIVQTLRSLSSAPSVTLQLVRADAPDDPEVTLPAFRLVEVDYDVIAVQGYLSLDSLENEPWPHQRYTPASHPGLFPL